MGKTPHKTRASSIGVLGTGSDVGKSLITTALCRVLYRRRIRVAPFKAQNMSLNSFVTAEGGEMGRAQVLQAQACGLSPHVDMNPILLKPETDQKSQVIVQGKVWDSQEANNYFGNKEALFDLVKDSYERLAQAYEVIVIEGAGSAAELNLRDRDIVNWPVVEMADAAVVLVADIDRGGVFAQVIGTMDLLKPEERQRVIGVVINKFRGDLGLFEDGAKIVEKRTGVPVLGVVPFLRHLDLDQEDSVELERLRMTPFELEKVNIAILLLPHMSNFTDFNLLGAEPDVALRYVASPDELNGADVIIIPGSKTTLADLEYLKKAGFKETLLRHVQHGGEVVGICGGFQMLGNEISDPQHVETGGWIKGFGLLNVYTELITQKRTVQVRARPLHLERNGECLVEGYEIHMGVTTRMGEMQPCFKVLSASTHSTLSQSSFLGHERVHRQPQLDAYDNVDGALNVDQCVWGTYIHGMFDSPAFRRQWLNRARGRKSLAPLEKEISEGVSHRFTRALDRWANHVENYCDVNKIFSCLGV